MQCVDNQASARERGTALSAAASVTGHVGVSLERPQNTIVNPKRKPRRPTPIRELNRKPNRTPMTGIRSTVFTIGFTTRVRIDNVHDRVYDEGKDRRLRNPQTTAILMQRDDNHGMLRPPNGASQMRAFCSKRNPIVNAVRKRRRTTLIGFSTWGETTRFSIGFSTG